MPRSFLFHSIATRRRLGFNCLSKKTALLRGDILRGSRQGALGEATSRTLGLARIAKQLTFHRIEAMRRCKKAITIWIPHDDSRRLRSDFDDVSVRHCPASVSVRA